MALNQRDKTIHPAWWTGILLLTIIGIVVVTALLFSDSFSSKAPVTLTADRAGLVMESGAKVKFRGVQVGRVATIGGGQEQVSLKLDMFPDDLKYIPANVDARIRATTAFGAKYVDLIYPSDPSPQRLAAGAVLKSQNTATEVNTVFENLVSVLNKVDPAKLNAIVSALAEGVRGQGETIGEATTAANQALLQFNPRSEQIRKDWQAFKGFSDAWAGAAPGLLKIGEEGATTAETITAHSQQLDALLMSVVGFSNSGIDLLAPNLANLISSFNTLRPTADLLYKYNPVYTCFFVGSKWWLDNGAYSTFGGNGRTVVLDAGLLPANDIYKYPDNLPIVGAKGGPGGKPGCGSLPDATKNFPVQMLITNTGFGTGLDWRPNPGIGFPGWANYFPVTRGNPQPPVIRNYYGVAPGPVVAPGQPPYGAPMYGPGGVPLWPGIPPAAPNPADGAAPLAEGPPPPAPTGPFPGEVQPVPPNVSNIQPPLPAP